MHFGLNTAGFQQLVLAVPKPAGQIDEISLRVLEALDLFPERVQLGKAVTADVADRRILVNAFAGLEQLHAQRAHGIIGHQVWMGSNST